MEKQLPVLQDPVRLERLLLEDSDEYWEAQRTAKNIQETWGIDYLYVLTKNESGWRFLLSSLYPKGIYKQEILKTQIKYKEDLGLKRAWDTKELVVHTFADAWGPLLIASRPIVKDGEVVGVIGADYHISHIQTKHYNALAVLIIALTGTVALSSLFLSKIRQIIVHLDKTVQERTKTLEEHIKIIEEANQSKSQFLFAMSHEIRTPMNAVIGFSELALREEINPQSKGYLENIRNAGNNLLAIINEILDFSKIESGRLDIISNEYSFTSLLNDVITISRMRIDGKPLLFITNIDSQLPNNLIGDEVRVKQVLLNLLTNAIKYSNKGYVLFTVSGEWVGDPNYSQIILTFTIKDTGIGIKPENMEKLFNQFSRFDSHKNRNIEGTGLGLTISRDLCWLMGGDIIVQSEYGKGSTFTIEITQKVKNHTPIAFVENRKTVLLYEESFSVYADSIIYSLKNLKVPVTITVEPSDFYRELAGNTYDFAFFSGNVAKASIDMVKDLKLKTVPILLGSLNDPPSLQIKTLSMPANTVSIADILNNVTGCSFETHKPSAASFTAPTARILVTDDFNTNLIVAKGLITPYKIQIDCCLSGQEAVNLVKKNIYDIIFMDHMMPGMDGIEAAAAIRALGIDLNVDVNGGVNAFSSSYFRNVPIIALTANVVSEMREIFQKNSFNDFLAKPIEISKLDDILRKWIPLEKMKEEAEEIRYRKAPGTTPNPSLNIPGIDVAQGIISTGGTESGYRSVLSVYLKDAEDRLEMLSPLIQDDFSADRQVKLAHFITQVHALKSASASIGAADLSGKARVLEEAGKAEDGDTIKKQLPIFCDNLKAMTAEIRNALHPATFAEAGGPAKAGEAQEKFKAQLTALRQFLETDTISAADSVMAELIEMPPFNEKIAETLAAISDQMLLAEYGEAIALIDSLLSVFS